VGRRGKRASARRKEGKALLCAASRPFEEKGREKSFLWSRNVEERGRGNLREGE